MAQGLTTNTVQTGGGTVSAGTNITGFSAAVMYDKGFTDQPKVRVLKAQFGDGYEMRVRDGINNAPREFALAFNTRAKADIDNLFEFFKTLASVDTCRLTIPDNSSGGSDETIIVVIEEYSRTLGNDEYYSLACKAREVFES
tara:strand:+ start:1125 stop:1550 length:426 start_codon:yes stop_codon:yes gene_type:complete